MNAPVVERTDPHLLAAARGDAPCDLAIDHARILNVFTGAFVEGCVGVLAGRIASVGPRVDARDRLDARGLTLIPGLLDAHMHVESTMLLPTEFARLASARGTTGAVLDPHEIANVLGLHGVWALMDDARDAPLHALWAAPSCVPASHLETSGSELGPSEIAHLLADDRVVALAEMMNFPGVVRALPDVLAKVRLGLAHGIVDGHAPGLSHRPLQAYAAAGISSDHEATTSEEAIEKISLGMRIFIREGSAARNLEALLPAVTRDTVGRFCFCTDDRHPADLLDEGHIDHVLRRAISLGLDPTWAIRMATINVAEHYRLPDLGAIAPGRLADLVLIDDLHAPRARLVLFQGRVSARDSEPVAPPRAKPSMTRAGSVTLPPGFSRESLLVRVSREGARIRVIGLRPGQLVTDSLIEPARVEQGLALSDPARDILKIAVVERHAKRGTTGLGFVRGFGLRRGAIASTIGHDSHNLAIVGTNDDDMTLAARTLADVGGGQCVVAEGAVLDVLALPIAGLISPDQAPVVVHRQRSLLDASNSLGCTLHDPFMPLSFLSLVVIPSLKLSDRGLVDVDRFDFVPLIVD